MRKEPSVANLEAALGPWYDKPEARCFVSSPRRIDVRQNKEVTPGVRLPVEVPGHVANSTLRGRIFFGHTNPKRQRGPSLTFRVGVEQGPGQVRVHLQRLRFQLSRAYFWAAN